MPPTRTPLKGPTAHLYRPPQFKSRYTLHKQALNHAQALDMALKLEKEGYSCVISVDQGTGWMAHPEYVVTARK